MSQENVGTVQRMLARWATGEFEPHPGEFDPDIILVVRPSFPEWGVFHGMEGMRSYMVRFLAQWESFTVEGKDLRVCGDTVLARVIQGGTAKKSGIGGEIESFLLVTFRGSSIVRMEFLMDEGEALEAAGLSE